MPKYKVGDVAALFSKPKNPTSAGGKKLQSLFEDYYNKNSKLVSYSEKKESNEISMNTEKNEVDNTSVSKKNRKRKFSSNDSELNENVFPKKFKKSSEQEEFSKSNGIRNNKKFGKQKDFPRKNKNHSQLNDKVFSKKFKESFEQEEGSKGSVSKTSKKQQDSPIKNKKSKVDSFNSTATFPKFDVGNDLENDTELPFVFNLQNVPKDSKQNKNFIKKSKKKSFDFNSSKSSNEVHSKDSDDNDDTLLKNEVREFMQNNSLKNKMEVSNDNVNKKKSFVSNEQNTMKKSKKKNLTNEVSSPQKFEELPKQGKKKFKKMNKDNSNNQQDFPRLQKKSKANSFNFGNTEFEIENGGVEQDSLLSTSQFVEKKDKKQSKKSKHGLNDAYANNCSPSENISEKNTPKTNKMADFKRKPKNKKSKDNALCNDDFKNSSSEVLDSGKADEDFKHKETNVNNMMQQKGSGVETLDFIKLPHSYEDETENEFEERLGRTLFVGNLPKSISKQELKNLFCTFGAIESMRLPGIETDKAKIYGKNPPKLLHSNYASDTIPGFVVFRDRQYAVEALKLSGYVFKGHHITVDFAMKKGCHKIYDDKRSIFIGNLPFDVKDESVWNAFNDCGRIEGVRVVRDRISGLGKGFGYVLFSTVEAKEKALAIKGLHIEGREIRIKAANSNKKAQQSKPAPVKRDTFKSRAIRLKKNTVTSGRKSIKKLTNKQKNLHKKKKIASILQKAMK